MINAAGGSARRLTDDKSEDVLPSWSRDGRWIYFGSRRSGDWQIWRMNMDNEQLEQVTRNGGFEAFESADGKTLYFAKREPGHLEDISRRRRRDSSSRTGDVGLLGGV